VTVASQVKQTLVHLQSAKASFESLHTRTQVGKAATAFQEASVELKEIIEDIRKRVEQLEFEEPQYNGD
jgi:fumarate hydratase class II